jgi:hypothetical protein
VPEANRARADAPPNRRRPRPAGWRSVKPGPGGSPALVCREPARGPRLRRTRRGDRGIARMATGSSTVPSKRRRPPQRGQASTSRSKAQRMRFAHAQ